MMVVLGILLIQAGEVAGQPKLEKMLRMVIRAEMAEMALQIL